jgi:hypothetical protein
MRMIETLEQRKSRLAMFAQDAVEARSDYRTDTAAVLARTARLRAERIARDAVIPLPAEPKAGTVALRPRKTASKSSIAAGKARTAV